MTAPDLSTVVPLKWKAWVGLIGSVLTLVIPWVAEIAVDLPQPWPLVVGGAVALLTALGVYRAPYVPPGAAVVPAPPPVVPDVDPPGGWERPWRKP